MTATSSAGTPLILVVLALGISFLSAVGSIAAVLMARANLQRQIQVAAREAWMREFREQVAQFLANLVPITGGRVAAMSAFQVISLLLAEKGTQYAEFIPVMNRPLLAVFSDGTTEERTRKLADRITEVSKAAADILRRERSLVEADARLMIPGLDVVGWRPWARLRAWLRRDPPRFPDLP